MIRLPFGLNGLGGIKCYCFCDVQILKLRGSFDCPGCGKALEVNGTYSVVIDCMVLGFLLARGCGLGLWLFQTGAKSLCVLISGLEDIWARLATGPDFGSSGRYYAWFGRKVTI